MLKSTLKKSLLIIALAVIPFAFYGQEEKTVAPSNYWFVGLEGGATSLFGDNKSYEMDKTSWDVNLAGGYVIQNSIYMYANVGYVNLGGKNGEAFEIDKCNLFQANLNLGYDVLQLFKLNPGRLMAIVPHAGFGFMQHKTKTKFENGLVSSTGFSDDEEGGGKGKGIGGRRHVYENPFGVNFIFNISKKFAANIDLVALKTDTDWLECVAGGDHNDWYAYANIGVSYKFGHKEKKQPEPAPCEPDEDAIQKAIDDAIQKYKEDNPCPEVEQVEEVEAIVESEDELDIRLTFAVGKSTVAKTQANYDQVKQISDAIDEGKVITSIVVIGYASPEGGVELNDNLAKNRALATVAFIKEKLGEKARGIKFEIEEKGADWDGFVNAIRNSEMTNKDEIISELQKSDNPSATLNQLTAKYPMIKSFFSDLRRTEVIAK